MNTPSNVVPEAIVESQAVAPQVMAETQPMRWAVRRELWENRSIYIAPAVVAALMQFGFLISTMTLRHRMSALALDAAKQRVAIEMPYDMAAGLILITSLIVGAFYCLDALYGERRDRSILFWKSLPVSDRTTVLSKASVPLVLLPLISFVIIVTTQIIMLFASTAVLLQDGPSVVALWTTLKFVQLWIALLYSVVAIALWLAPLYCWLLLLSCWAKRATLLWAVLPPLAIMMVEKMAFNTTSFALFMKYRLIGWFSQAFIDEHHGPLSAMTPGRFLSTPSLWLGLIFAAACLAAAVRLRRNREPI